MTLELGESLRAALGAPAVIRQLPSSPRSRVWLVEFDGEPAVVKQIIDRPGAGKWYAREETALRLAGRARPSCPPCCRRIRRSASWSWSTWPNGPAAASG